MANTKLVDQWTKDWEQCKNRVHVYARKRAKEIQWAWSGTGQLPNVNGPRELVQKAWEQIVRRGKPRNPQKTTPYLFFVGHIREVVRDEVAKGRKIKEEMKFTVLETIEFSLGDPASNSAEEQVAIDHFKRFVDQKNSKLLPALEHILTKDSSTTSLVEHLSVSERTVRNMKNEIRVLYGEFDGAKFASVVQRHRSAEKLDD